MEIVSNETSRGYGEISDVLEVKEEVLERSYKIVDWEEEGLLLVRVQFGGLEMC